MDISGIGGNGVSPIAPLGKEQRPIAREKETQPASRTDEVLMGAPASLQEEVKAEPRASMPSAGITSEVKQEASGNRVSAPEGFYFSSAGVNSLDVEMFSDLGLNGPGRLDLEQGLISATGQPVNTPKFIVLE